MKRLYALILLLASLTGIAHAEEKLTITELKTTAPARWEQSYENIRGEVISVDVPILIPDAEAFPCLTTDHITPSEVLPLAGDMGTSVSVDDFEYSNLADGFIYYNWPSNKVHQAMTKVARKNGTYKEYKGGPRNLILSAGQFDLDTAYSVNNPVTAGEAVSMMREYAERFFPGRGIELTPYRVEAHIDPGVYKYNKKLGDYVKVKDCPDFEGHLCVLCNQVLSGIPVLGWCYEGFAGHMGANMKGEAQGSLGGYIWTYGMKYLGSEEIGQVVGLNLLQVAAVNQGDVPLCPVSKVLATVENFIREGKLRSVDSMRLGYVAWLNKDGSYLLMPTWAIEGEVFKDARTELRHAKNIYGNRPEEYQYLYINAQTGEVIDPFNQAKNRSYDAPKLVRWK